MADVRPDDAVVGSVSHILHGVLKDFVDSADEALLKYADTAGAAVLSEGQRVREPAGQTQSAPFLPEAAAAASISSRHLLLIIIADRRTQGQDRSVHARR